MNNSNEQIKLAMQRHQGGDLVAAEKIYRQILNSEPNHPDALHLLGVLAGQSGKHDAALDLIGRAIQIKPNYPDAYKNMGTIYAQMGRFDEAIEAYKKVAEMRPDNAESYRDLGVVYKSAGRLAEAAAAYTQVVRLDPNSPESQRSLGKALAIYGRVEEAAAAYLRAIKLKPGWMDAHFNLAELYQGASRWEEALAEYRRVTQLKPDMFEAHNNMANILKDMGRWDQSIAAYRKAVQLKPDNATVHFNLGQTFQAADRLEEAVAEYRLTIQIDPKYFPAHASMAITLATLQRYDEAMKCHAAAAAIDADSAITHVAMGEILLHKLDAQAAIGHLRRAVTVEPGNPSAWGRLGTALRAAGKFDEAADAFRRVMALQPDSAAGYQGLATTGKTTSGPAEIDRLTAMLNQPGLPAEERVGVGFALGKMLDDADRYDEAFARFAEANALVKQLRAMAGETFDPAIMRSLIDELIEVAIPSYFEQRPDWGDPSEVPVFVVGMPRSGTTLVQQIVGSHPQVHVAGELRDINAISQSLGGTDVKGGAGVEAGSDPQSGRAACAAPARNESDRVADCGQIARQCPGPRLHLRAVSTGAGGSVPPGCTR